MEPPTTATDYINNLKIQAKQYTRNLSIYMKLNHFTTIQIFLFVLLFSFISTILLFLFSNTTNTLNTSKAYNLIVQINDLEKIKKSLEREYLLYEIKRNNLLINIEELKQKYEFVNSSFYDMHMKYVFLKSKLFYGLVNELQAGNLMNNQFEIQKNIEIQNEFNTKLVETVQPVQFVKQQSSTRVTLDSCVYLSRCEYNRPIRLFFLNEPSGLDFHFKNQQNEVFEIVGNINDACLTVYFIEKNFNLTIDQIKPNRTNVLIIDLIKPNERRDGSFIEKIPKCGLYATYDMAHLSERPNNRDKLNIHFSILSLKHFNLNSFTFDNNLLFLTHKRKFFLSYSENAHNGRVSFLYKNKLNLLETFMSGLNKYQLLKIDLNCAQIDSGTSLCDSTDEREMVLLHSTFTLILLNDESVWSIDNTIRLVEALSVGTIPVVFDIDVDLPLSEFIQWNEVIIRVPFSRLNYLNVILMGYNDADIISRRIKAFNIFKAYFANEYKQFTTLITYIRYRLNIPAVGFYDHNGAEHRINENNNQTVFEEFKIQVNDITKEEFHDSDEYLGPVDDLKIPSKSYQYNFSQNTYNLWNKYYMPFKLFPSTPHDPFVPTNIKYSLPPDTNLDLLYTNVQNISNSFLIGGSNSGHYFLHKGLGGNHDDEQFTIIILTYKREKILSLIIDKYLTIPYLNKIIVVWNSLEVKPTDAFLYRYRTFININKLHIIQSTKNSLNNRFLPYRQIETDAILNLDDDTPLRNDEISFAFRVWRENRHRLIGFPARFHTWNMTDQKYLYATKRSCEYSLILTGAVFYHRFYHYMYSYMVDDRVRDMVDRYKNCEDLAFNYMIASFTRQPPIKATSRIRFFCRLCEQYNETSGSSTNPLHYSQRTDCINELNLIYGYNPLLYSQTRVDSVLFKTKLDPEHKKCFKYL